MPEKEVIKDPASWGIATWLLVFGVSMIGGISGWYKRIKAGHPRSFNMAELVGEIATSALMGFVGFIAALNYLESVGWASAIGGMSAHFSTRLLFQAEGLLDVVAKKVYAKVGAGDVHIHARKHGRRVHDEMGEE